MKLSTTTAARSAILLSLSLLAPAMLTSCYAQGEEAAASNQPANQPSNQPAQEKLSEAGLRLAALSIKSGSNRHEFVVEIARSGEEQNRGLMFRTKLAPDEGMIFPFESDRMASFWMKNTVIPLDIIFIRRDRTIESIAANTVPYSLDPVQSGEPVATVLELPGGRAAELAIQPGDKVAW